MKNNIFNICCIIILAMEVNAHNPAISTHYLFNQNDQWMLRSELPWSIRNALTDQYPFLLEEGTTEQEFQDCFEEYLTTNLSLKFDGEHVSFKSIKALPGDHGHSYLFLSELNAPANVKEIAIDNQLMFSLFKKQKNIHVINNKGNELKCISTAKSGPCHFAL